MSAPTRLAAVLSQLPPAQYAFAYGSGVLRQPGLYPGLAGLTSCAAQVCAQEPSGPMIDYFLAVENPLKWHTENIRCNPDHYSWVSKLGPRAITGIADHIGLGIHFNTLVRMKGGELVKYGVISTHSLLDDLRTWRHMYVAGRLQKPVLSLWSHVAELEAAQQANLRSAAAAALLLLPPTFTTKDLLSKVVTLSYSGDVRLGIAEDPQKVERILQGSRPALDALYLPLISKAHQALSDTNEQSIQSSSAQQPSNEAGSAEPSAGESTSSSQRLTSNAGQLSSDNLDSGNNSRVASNNGNSSSSSSRCSSSSSSSTSYLGRLARVRLVSSEGSHLQDIASSGGAAGPTEAVWEQCTSAETQGELFKQLPRALLTRVAYKLNFQVPEVHLVPNKAHGSAAFHDTLNDVTCAAVHSGRIQQLVEQAIKATVRMSSASQALSGLLAAGGGKAVRYVGAKVAKAAQGAVDRARKSELMAKRPL